MNILQVNTNNIYYLEKFILNDLPSTFRYFKTRDYKEAINTHKLTIVGLIDEDPVCYGHIDFDCNLNWVGLCVLKEHQGKGYGKALLQYLFDFSQANNIYDLHLTVDIDNNVAINLYKSFGFEVNKIFFDKLALVRYFGNEVQISSSLSECFNKLSQLEILLDSTTKKDTKQVKSYNDIFKKLEPFMDSNVEYHYNILKLTNNELFKLKSNNEKTQEQYKHIEICEERLERIKNKIDWLLYSKESNFKFSNKPKKKAFLFGHLGLGDTLTTNGLVRYITTLYDEVIYVCKKGYIDNLKIIFKDEPSLVLYPIESDIEMITTMYDEEKFKEVIGEGDRELITLGFNNIQKDFKDIVVDLLPFSFHDDVGLTYDIFWEYFHVPDTQVTFDLLNLLVRKNIKDYVFIHNTTSTGKYFKSNMVEEHCKKSKDEILYINVNENEYEKDHMFYSLAEVFVNRPFIDYKQIIVNALHIYVTNSSFFCMAINLPIKTENCYCVTTTDISYFYDDTHYFDKTTDRRKFIQINKERCN